MAQTKTLRVSGVEGMGGFSKCKLAQINVINTGAETTQTITAADAGMSGFQAWFASNNNASAVGIVPTYVGGICVSLALTFGAGNEVDVFVIGF